MHQMVFIDYSLHAMDVTVTAHSPLLHSALCLSAPGGTDWGRGELYRAAISGMRMLRASEAASRHVPKLHTHTHTQVCKGHLCRDFALDFHSFFIV